MAWKLEDWQSKENRRGLSTASSHCQEGQETEGKSLCSWNPGALAQGLLPHQQPGPLSETPKLVPLPASDLLSCLLPQGLTGSQLSKEPNVLLELTAPVIPLRIYKYKAKR